MVFFNIDAEETRNGKFQNNFKWVILKNSKNVIFPRSVFSFDSMSEDFLPKSISGIKSEAMPSSSSILVTMCFRRFWFGRYSRVTLTCYSFDVLGVLDLILFGYFRSLSLFFLCGGITCKSISGKSIQFLRRIYDWWYSQNFLTHRVPQASFVCFWTVYRVCRKLQRELGHTVKSLADVSFDRFWCCKLLFLWIFVV